ncbi:hypothetical protein DUI87_06924 [Hirundo rustica rustica]|uniref:Uncharacterized protein n=1 Tax=Hirundo rustica rustica TaxID=333673 RepID=A0A3M0KVE4_HIRRU|nr:hypothetical protein DUI87_06924 [Hirundo rustica rustica]
MARGQQELLPPSPWGTVAAGRAQGTPSLESRSLEGLRHGSAARQGLCRPPLHPAHSLPLGTGIQPAWKHLGLSETKDLVEGPEERGENTHRDHFGGLSPYLGEDRSIMSTCTHEQSSVHREVGAGSLELPNASTSSKCSSAEAGKCSELLSPAELTEQSSVSEDSQPWDTSLKDLEEKREEEELPETEAAREQDSDLQSKSLTPLKENEVESEASALAGGSSEEGHSELLLTSEPEETADFSASPLSGGPGEEMATCFPAEHAALHKQVCVGPDASIHLMREKREELETLEEDKMHAELFGDISSSMGNEESPMTSSCVLRAPASPTLEEVGGPLVSHSACSVTEDTTGQTPNSSEFVCPDLLSDSGCDSDDSPSLETLLMELLEKWEREEAAGERDGEVQSLSSLPPRDEELEPAPTPPDSDLSDEGHNEPLPAALAEDPERFEVCASPAGAADEADAAWVEGGCAQPAPDQEKNCRVESPASACPEPAQSLPHHVPACPAGSADVPQPPAPRRWRSMVKRARRAVRRLFSFSCLRGQPEE